VPALDLSLGLRVAPRTCCMSLPSSHLARSSAT
jgi:hypothetical protein